MGRPYEADSRHRKATSQEACSFLLVNFLKPEVLTADTPIPTRECHHTGGAGARNFAIGDLPV